MNHEILSERFLVRCFVPKLEPRQSRLQESAQIRFWRCISRNALCRRMGELPSEIYRRKALADPPGRLSVLWYVRRELFKLLRGNARRGKHRFPGPMPLDTCIAAFGPFGGFQRNFDSKGIEHILEIRDQKRLSALCAFHVRSPLPISALA